MNHRFSRLMGSSRKADEEPDRLSDILRRIPIFEELSKREIAALERILHKREYKRDEVIFRQDEPGMGMYIIESGQVAIISEPAEVHLSELGSGEFFGELALLDEAPRSATAIAQTECKIFGFFQPDLFALLDRSPRLGVKIVLRLAKIIGERLRRANDQIQSTRQELDLSRLNPEQP